MVEQVPEFRSLPRRFYRQTTELVARKLLGKLLVRELDGRLLGGIIVETEAYLQQQDDACHAARGPTPGNRVMFGQPGWLYVYPIHAKHCMNAVTERSGAGCAVLIRAVQPIWGIAKMQQLRQQDRIRELLNGPGKLCQGLAVGRCENGLDLVNSKKLQIGSWEAIKLLPERIATSPRIGISKSTDLPLRFFVDRNRYVSGPQKWHTGSADQEIVVARKPARKKSSR